MAAHINLHELILDEPTIDKDFGYRYGRRLHAGEFAGQAVFSFEGDRAERIFKLNIELSDGLERYSASRQSADAAALVEVLRNDEEFARTLEELEFTEELVA